MKYSKAWLQNYIIETLSEDKIIEEELNAKAFEVEGIELVGIKGNSDWTNILPIDDILLPADSIFDIKVLPNRAHDALGHIGMARELCACLDLTFNNKLDSEIQDIKNNILEKNENFNFSDEKVLVEIKDEKACTRFVTVKIDGVKVGESPEFIKVALNRIGQKSINNIVDITNYVQFTLNKPMHAYDANNIEGGIIVRYAEEGEKLITLDDKELELNTNTLVISDHVKALGLAGIKGGKFSGVNKDTTSIIIESANFEPVLIRKTSQKYNLKTDASKRFENGISDKLAEDALYYTVKLILENCTENNEVKISEVTDIKTRENKTFKVGVSLQEVNSILGSDYEDKIVEEVLNKLNFKFEKVIPLEKIKSLIPETLDKPYFRLASTLYDAPNRFSCGSLVNYFFVQSGYPTPRIAVDMYFFSKKIEKKDLVFGDIIFTNTLVQNPKDSMIYSKVLNKMIPDVPVYKKTVEFMRGQNFDSGIDHVGIFIGEGKVLHCSSLIGKTIIENIDESPYFKNECWYGRFVEDLNIPQYVINVPHERLDLKIKEDIIEEIGRIIGYKTLTPTLPKLEPKKNYLNKKVSYQNVIRNILLENNFSEVMNYSFVEKGEISLIKSAVNKNKLRTNIADGMLVAMNQNLSNLPVLNIEAVKVFEFGNVFSKEIESNNLCIGIDDGKKKSNFAESVDMILGKIENKLNLKKLEYEIKSTKPYIIEINFDKVIEGLDNEYIDTFIDEKYINRDTKFISYSNMPFIVRDIAFWIDENNELLVDKNENKDVILELIKSVGGDLCTKVTKFDEFKKEVDGVQKISLGYRLLYQSFEKTLTDEEVNVQSDNVYKKLKELGLEVR